MCLKKADSNDKDLGTVVEVQDFQCSSSGMKGAVAVLDREPTSYVLVFCKQYFN